MQNNEGFGRLFHSCDEGITLPKRVFGCYKLKKEKVSSPLLFALRSGCSAVDTAFVYNNESDVGKTLNDAGMSPLLITKLWRSHYSFSASEVEGRLNDHMAALGRRVDVWLIHFPGPGRHPSLKQNKPLDWSPAMRVATWKAMVDLQRAKKVRAVGVSNFSVRQMQSLFDGTGSWPCLNQIECHLLCKRTDIVKFCRERNIVVMAYGVLGSRESALLELPEVQEMALHHSCSCGAVLLAWAAAKEIVVVFGSTSERHIAENLSENQVVLSVDEIRILDSLEEKKGTFVFGWKGLIDLDSVDTL